jgi:NAD(P)-dependent dehydrogenase (short-subunit alcohol dehydrogenase family)
MKTFLITGANVGIGFATAAHLARQSEVRVLLACRSQMKANTAMAAIRQSNPSANLTFVALDLFSLASIRRIPAMLSSMGLPGLSGLVLNAGGINMKAKSLEFTEDGFERTFQLNFLGHFLLANLLIRFMAESSRIVFVSSDLHDPAATGMGRFMPPKYGVVEDLARATGSAANLKPIARYATAKMYAMMAACELERKLKNAGRAIAVNSWSPGVVPTTQAGRDMNPIMKTIMTSEWFVHLMGSHLSTEEEAARALGDLVFAEQFAGVSGKYFDGFEEIPSSAESRDETKARMVWEQSAKLVALDQGDDDSI